MNFVDTNILKSWMSGSNFYGRNSQWEYNSFPVRQVEVVIDFVTL